VTYAEIAGCVLAATVLLDLAVLRTRLLARRAFWVSYLIILCFQLLVNGVLAGRHVVEYNRADILGPRVAFAPVEDLLFGFSLVTQTLCWWVWWGRRGIGRPIGR
jgi:lycopene cyclase domain-containing protein